MNKREDMLRGALLTILGFRDHLQGCEVDQTDFCTCGMKQAADNARAVMALPPDKDVAELIHPLDLGLMYNNTPHNQMIADAELAKKVDDLIEYRGRLYYQTTRVPPSEEALRSVRWGHR